MSIFYNRDRSLLSNREYDRHPASVAQSDARPTGDQEVREGLTDCVLKGNGYTLKGDNSFKTFWSLSEKGSCLKGKKLPPV